MNSIHSFIIYIFATMYGGAVSATNGWLVSCLLGAFLPFGPSWSLISALVPSCSSLWLLGPVFLWRSYSSRLWFCLVRHSIAAARVCTCLSRAIVRGSSPWWLLVAIEQVSTIQLFVWEVVVWLLLRESFPQMVPTDDAKNYQWVAQSSRALDRTYKIETKRTLQRVLVWYWPNTHQKLS